MHAAERVQLFEQVRIVRGGSRRTGLRCALARLHLVRDRLLARVFRCGRLCRHQVTPAR